MVTDVLSLLLVTVVIFLSGFIPILFNESLTAVALKNPVCFMVS